MPDWIPIVTMFMSFVGLSLGLIALGLRLLFRGALHRGGYRCDCCGEHHDGPVADMRVQGWLVFPGSVHYCINCRTACLKVLYPEPTTLRRFDGDDSTNPYQPPRGA